MPGTCAHTHTVIFGLRTSKQARRKEREKEEKEGRKEGRRRGNILRTRPNPSVRMHRTARAERCTLSRALISDQNRAFISTVLMSI